MLINTAHYRKVRSRELAIMKIFSEEKKIQF